MCRCLIIHFNVQHGRLVAPDPAQAPARGYYVAYDVDFHLVGGQKEVEIGVHELQQMVHALVREGEGLGGEAEFGGVYRRIGEVIGSLGAAGLGAVDAGRFGP